MREIVLFNGTRLFVGNTALRLAACGLNSAVVPVGAEIPLAFNNVKPVVALVNHVFGNGICFGQNTYKRKSC